MGSLFGLKSMIMFSAVLLSIGTVSAQQAFAGFTCNAIKDGNWNDPNTWEDCDMGIPDGSGKNADIFGEVDIIITGNEEARELRIAEGSSLFIDCDASLALFGGYLNGPSEITNHGEFTSNPENFDVINFANFFNSGDYSNVTTSEGGQIVDISSICDRPIGGTVGSMDTVSLLVAGTQTNMGWWTIALVGAVTVSGIVLKKRLAKTDE